MPHHACPCCGARVLPFPAGAATRLICTACDLDIIGPVLAEPVFPNIDLPDPSRSAARHRAPIVPMGVCA